jgi:hypothetical protein
MARSGGVRPANIDEVSRPGGGLPISLGEAPIYGHRGGRTINGIRARGEGEPPSIAEVHCCMGAGPSAPLRTRRTSPARKTNRKYRRAPNRRVTTTVQNRGARGTGPGPFGTFKG